MDTEPQLSHQEKVTPSSAEQLILEAIKYAKRRGSEIITTGAVRAALEDQSNEHDPQLAADILKHPAKYVDEMQKDLVWQRELGKEQQYGPRLGDVLDTMARKGLIQRNEEKIELGEEKIQTRIDYKLLDN